MSELCKWLHEQLEQLPLIKFPFKLEQLPENGIYFFYEDGEIWGHGEISREQSELALIGTEISEAVLRNTTFWMIQK